MVATPAVILKQVLKSGTQTVLWLVVQHSVANFSERNYRTNVQKLSFFVINYRTNDPPIIVHIIVQKTSKKFADERGVEVKFTFWRHPLSVIEIFDERGVKNFLFEYPSCPSSRFFWRAGGGKLAVWRPLCPSTEILASERRKIIYLHKINMSK